MAKVEYIRPCRMPLRSNLTEDDYDNAIKEHNRLLFEYGYFTQRDFPEIMVQDLIDSKKMKDMRVKYSANSEHYNLIKDNVYDVISVVENYYEIIDNNDEDHLFPSEFFAIINNGHVM